jgi:formate dehydrogenase iron-sulfur subunit
MILDPTNQPDSGENSPAKELQGRPNWNPSRPGPELLEALRQEIPANGMPGADRIREIAEEYNTTAAKVRGVIGYYSDLSKDSTSIKVCMGEACRSRGAANVFQGLKDDGKNVDMIHCTGRCACGPITIENEAVVPVAKSGATDGCQFFVSLDTASLELGCEELAEHLLELIGKDDSLVRTGSRGLFHLEPMVEVETNGQRVAFGPVGTEDLKSVCSAVASDDLAKHAKFLGPIAELDLMKSQTRLAMDRLGERHPNDLEGMKGIGAYAGLTKARKIGNEGILKSIEKAGLRGRGGAGFPAHFKWNAAAKEQSKVKYVVANADEGDAGTFIDRMIIEGDPHALIEGMLIVAEAIGATYGHVYLRSEYPEAKTILQQAIDDARADGLFGDSYDMEINVGAGAYVCGEETALLESLEGRRGEVRARPPFPAQEGLFGKPTIVNNVLTLAMAAAIMREGEEKVSVLGTEKSKGTVVAQIVGKVPRPVCVEVPFGCTVGGLLREYSGIEGVTAVQVGGPLGSVFRTSELDDVELSFEGLTEGGGLLGHGGFVCYGEDFSPRKEVIHWMEFFKDESCGKCTPCRIGTQRALEMLNRIGTGEERDGDRVLLDDLDEVMTNTSLCALGGLAMNPVRSTMQKWPDAFPEKVDVGKKTK